MNMRKLVIFGAGGFGQEAAWVAESMNDQLPTHTRWEILGFLDDDPSKAGRQYFGHKTLSTRPTESDIWYYCAVGRNITREKISQRLDGYGWKAATLVHASVISARGVEIGEGTYVGPGSILSPMAQVGRHVIINQRVSIGHDAVLGDFSQACPGAQINGYCRLGRYALVGSNASIHQGKKVGEKAVVGSNSQVITDVATSTSVCGVPARVLFSES